MTVNDIPSPVKPLDSQVTSHLIPYCFPPESPESFPEPSETAEKAGSLDPYRVSSLGSPGFHRQLSECGEKLLHFLL